MRILAKPQVWGALQQLLPMTEELFVAMAFLTRHEGVLRLLAAVPKVRIVVSAQWTSTNPYAVEDLSVGGVDVRMIRGDDDNGQLHAKAMVGTLQSGGHFGMVGSANLTPGGLEHHRELACLLRSPDDDAALDELAVQIEDLWEAGEEVGDLERAKEIWNGRKDRRPTIPRKPESGRYWILKCSAGNHGRVMWDEFVGDQVVAVGWPLPTDPCELSDDELAAAFDNQDYKPKGMQKVRTFYNDFRPGHRVLVIRGFAPNQEKPVTVHGLAVVTGEPRYDADSDWPGEQWNHKAPADVLRVDLLVPIATIRSALGLDSCLETIHPTTEAAWNQMIRLLAEYVSIPSAYR